MKLLGRYPALNAPKQKSAFVWFMATAPDEALLTIEGHPLSADRLPKRLGSIALDTAVTQR